MSRRKPSTPEERQDRAVNAFVRTARQRDPAKVAEVFRRNPVRNLHGTDLEQTVGLMLDNVADLRFGFPGQVRFVTNDRLLSPRWRP